jgi:hypothetical protein
VTISSCWFLCPPGQRISNEGCDFEADLHRHYNLCTKNPGHHQFIPVDQFNVEHLPPGCQNKELMGLVRALADVTVRVSVDYVSENRPETLGGKPYPCYKDRGSNLMRVGTGGIRRVIIYTCQQNKKCPCRKCRNSPTPETRFARIYVQTATHLIYDDLEAAHTTCHLFFDRGGTPDCCSGVVALYGWHFISKDDLRDCSVMVHATHDIGFAHRLSRMLKIWITLASNIYQKHCRQERWQEKPSSSVEERPDAMDNLVIAVAHPHGCSKQISVGYCIDNVVDFTTTTYSAFTYTTAACPGSSGAHIFMISSRKIRYYDYYIHVGAFSESRYLNYCNDIF